MLLELADLLSGWYRGFHLFQYLTFRAIMSMVQYAATTAGSTGPAGRYPAGAEGSSP